MKPVLFAALLAVPAFAAETEGGEKAGPSPIWLWLNFAILIAVLAWLIAKNLGPALTARSQEISEGLAAGERAKADAASRAAAVQARLAGLDAAIAKMRADSHEELGRETDRLRRETAAELARIQQTSELEVESAGKLARLELQRYTAKLAIDLAEQKVRARMSPEKQAELVSGFAGDLAAGSLR